MPDIGLFLWPEQVFGTGIKLCNIHLLKAAFLFEIYMRESRNILDAFDWKIEMLVIITKLIIKLIPAII